MGKVCFKADQLYSDIPKIKHKDDLDLNDKEVRKQLIEIAVDQFARLFWEQALLENQNSRDKRKKQENHPA